MGGRPGKPAPGTGLPRFNPRPPFYGRATHDQPGADRPAAVSIRARRFMGGRPGHRAGLHEGALDVSIRARRFMGGRPSTGLPAAARALCFNPRPPFYGRATSSGITQVTDSTFQSAPAVLWAGDLGIEDFRKRFQVSIRARRFMGGRRFPPKPGPRCLQVSIRARRFMGGRQRVNVEVAVGGSVSIRARRFMGGRHYGLDDLAEHAVFQSAPAVLWAGDRPVATAIAIKVVFQSAPAVLWAGDQTSWDVSSRLWLFQSAPAVLWAGDRFTRWHSSQFPKVSIRARRFMGGRPRQAGGSCITRSAFQSAPAVLWAGDRPARSPSATASRFQSAPAVLWAGDRAARVDWGWMQVSIRARRFMGGRPLARQVERGCAAMFQSAPAVLWAGDAPRTRNWL